MLLVKSFVSLGPSLAISRRHLVVVVVGGGGGSGASKDGGPQRVANKVLHMLNATDRARVHTPHMYTHEKKDKRAENGPTYW